MSNVSYTLLKMNRVVTVKSKNLQTIMLYRDFKNLIKKYDLQISKDNSLVIGYGGSIGIEIYEHN